MVPNNQLETYIIDVRSNDQFFELKGICDLARKTVEKKKNHCVSTCLFACYMTFGPRNCNCNRGKNIFYYEYCEKNFYEIEWEING